MPKRSPPLILLIGILFSACVPVTSTGTTPAGTTNEAPGTDTPVTPVLEEIPVYVGHGAKGSFFEIYFTDPSNPASKQQSGGIEQALIASIDAARLSVDVAVYSFSLREVGNALLRARDRGVTVRVVMESDNMDRSVPEALVEGGIRILGDRRESLMHNKFIIIDRSEVWTGSMNFTVTGAYEDNNGLIHIRSKEVAENYLTEFEEMYTRDLFGTDALASTPNPSVTVDDIQIETYFSPDDGVASQLLQLLQGAQESIYFLVYSFTSDPIAQVIRNQHEAGITVAGVMDDELVDSNDGSEFEFFLGSDLNVRRDGNQGLMHHKIIIIDRSIVVTGSYNLTASADERNDENILIIHSPDIAEYFLSEFERIFEMALQP